MDSDELAEYLAETSPGDPYYELLILDFGTDLIAWWACNLCGVDLDGQPCPDHAPNQVPGLALVDCDANPRHWVWTLDGEQNGYGNPCPQCRLAEYYERDRQERQCRHWPWRRWQLTKWAARNAYALGVISGYSTGTGDSCDWCVRFNSALRGSRPYILFASRETWRCWLKGRHLRGEEVGFGFCGKCIPWRCCGAETDAHASGCPEDDRVTVS